MKGVLAMKGSPQKFVYQGVHMQFTGDFMEHWKEGEPRNNRLVFIGKNLDRERLVAGFNACRDIHSFIAEADITSTILRFALGDSVRVKTAPSEFTLGVVCAPFHKEPMFPPGYVVPYQVRLSNGSSVYVPADTEDFVRAPEPSAKNVIDGAVEAVAT